MTDMEINSAIADRARSGALLTEAELLELEAGDVLSLGMLADEVRRARVGDRVSYTRVLEIGADWNGQPDVVTAALAGADEVRLTSLDPTLEETAARVARVRTAIGPARRLTGFSLAPLASGEWGSLPSVLGALRDAGLDALVEAPLDIVSPRDVALAVDARLPPGTLSVQRWPDNGPIGVLMRARHILEAVSGLTRISPLSREQSVTAPTTGYHDVRMVALARLALPMADVVEVDWQQYGPKLAQVALMFGANHLDRVSPFDDPALGPRRATVEEVRRNIRAAGFVPADEGGTT